MMLRDMSRTDRRRGVILPLVALLIVVLISMLAFVMDLGLVTVYRAGLQNAADSAALASASALGTDNLIRPAGFFDQGPDMIAARQLAQKFAQANAVNLNGSVKVVLDSSNDVSGGTLSNPDDLSLPLVSTRTAPINSIRVRTFADSAHSGNVNFLFAPVMNIRSTTVQMSGTATVEVRKIVGMRPQPGLRSPILPITMSYLDWLAMVNNLTNVDTYYADPTTGRVVAGSDGLQEQQLYPGSNVSSSNNGLLQFGVNSHSNSVLKDQIVNGPTMGQLLDQWPTTRGSPPWTSQHTFTIGADPGWRATNFDDLAAVAASGEPRLIPLNDGTPPGNGANGSYTIVAFAAVRVVVSNGGGKSSGSAWVQPAVINDPTLVGGGIAGPGEGGIPVVRLTR